MRVKVVFYRGNGGIEGAPEDLDYFVVEGADDYEIAFRINQVLSDRKTEWRVGDKLRIEEVG